MKKLFLMIVAMLSMSTVAMAQDVYNNNNEAGAGANTEVANADYTIKVAKGTMMKYLGLGGTLAERWDIWQNELQEQIDSAMTGNEAERSAKLKAAVNPYLAKVQKHVDTATYEKYLNIFNAQCKNKHLDGYLK